jgi:hypothetical protein
MNVIPFEVLRALKISMLVSWVITPCGLKSGMFL